MRRSTKLVGAAGEHFAMYELLRRNFVAALVPEGTPNMDILVSDEQGGRVAAIQVKTASKRGPKWPMSPRLETVIQNRLFYCLLMPTGNVMESFQSWLVPSKVVAEHLRETNDHWLSEPRKDGSRRKETDRRNFHHQYSKIAKYQKGWLNKYLDNWDSILA